jgi:NADH:ubiquinone oxidoreductase subunit 2 (subunit N)
VVTRALSLLPEACLAVAGAVAFVAMAVSGSRAGRIAGRIAVAGAVAAALAALATLTTDDEWMFGGYRVDIIAQSAKTVVAAGLVLAAMLARRTQDPWAGARTVGPFFRLVGALALCAAASSQDLLTTWLALETAMATLVITAAAEGRWDTGARLVRRLVGVVLPAALVIGLGVVTAAAAAGSTRYVDLAGAGPRDYAPHAFAAGIALVVLGILGRMAAVSWHLRASRVAAPAGQGLPEIALVAGSLAAAGRLMGLVLGQLS